MHGDAMFEVDAVLLVGVHPFAQQVEVVLRLLEQIPFDAQMPEERHRHAHLLTRRAVRGVRGAGADMLANHLRRHEQRRVALDVGALHRIHAVGGPDAVCELENAHVDAAAARRAAFNLQAGVGGLQVVEHAVDGERLPMDRAAAGARGDRLGHVLVVVPFDVVDAELADERVHAAVHIRIRLRIRQVDDLLVAPLHRQAVRGGHEHPVGVLAVHRGIRVHHLRFEPQAELHSLGMHVVCKRLERVLAVGPHVLGDPPVAQTRRVTTAVAEPAVVDHEALDAARGSLVCEPDKRIVIMLEIHGLPGVQDHRTRLVGNAMLGTPTRMGGAQVGVEACGDFVEPLAEGTVEPRRGVGVRGIMQRDLTARKHFRAADHTGRVWQALRRHE